MRADLGVLEINWAVEVVGRLRFKGVFEVVVVVVVEEEDEDEEQESKNERQPLGASMEPEEDERWWLLLVMVFLTSCNALLDPCCKKGTKN